MGHKIGAMKRAAKIIGISFEKYMEYIDGGEKWCTAGKHWQPRTNFGPDKSRGDGLAMSCNNCRRVDNPYVSLRGRVSTFKGKVHTEEAKRKMSEAKKGMKLRLGKKHTIATREKISRISRERSPKGKDAPSYIDGKGIERRGMRSSDRYKQWRYDVYLRDKFTCQKCGDSSGGNLNAHHVKPFSDCPELRFDISNGITLCESCHKKEHSRR